MPDKNDLREDRFMLASVIWSTTTGRIWGGTALSGVVRASGHGFPYLGWLGSKGSGRNQRWMSRLPTANLHLLIRTSISKVPKISKMVALAEDRAFDT